MTDSVIVFLFFAFLGFVFTGFLLALSKRLAMVETLLHATIDALRAEQAARLRFQHGRNWQEIIDATDEMDEARGQRH